MEYTNLASEGSLDALVKNLKDRNIEAIVCENKEEALQKIKELIPSGSSINNGASKTLEEIGFVQFLKEGEHGWSNLHAQVLNESDPDKQKELRKKSVFSDFYIGSVHALSEEGEFVIASATGSQLPHVVYTSPNLLFVVSTQKVVPNLEAAMQRLRNHVYPLENERMKSTGADGSVLSKILVFEREPIWSGRSVRIILVKEKLGF